MHLGVAVAQLKLEARKITREHTPTDLRERARCLDAGAHVSQPTEPGLADARLWRNPEMTEIGITVSGDFAESLIFIYRVLETIGEQ